MQPIIRRFTAFAFVSLLVASAAVASPRGSVLSGSRDASAPVDALSAANLAGFSADDAKLPETTYRVKRGGAIIWDNGSFNGTNGLASELGTIVSEAETSDDFFLLGSTDIDHATAELLVSGPPNGLLRIYNDSFGIPGTLSTSYNTTDAMFLGTGFGFENREYQWDTSGLSLGPGRYWVVPMQVGGARGFFSTSTAPDPQAVGQFRSAFFGFPNWTPHTVIFPRQDFAFKLYEPDSGGGGGDCDLSPIEAKLDDETLFTDDDELAEHHDGVMSRFDSVDAQLASLETKMDQLQADMDQLKDAVCDVIRLLHTPSGVRTAGPVDACGGQSYDWNKEGTERRD